MENKENILETELLEPLWYVINDILVISKEFEWAWKPQEKKVTKMRLLEKFKEICKKSKNYFTDAQILWYPPLLVGTLEKLLEELEIFSLKIKDFPDEKKEKIVSFIKSKLEEISKWKSFNLSQKFRDMIFIELWLDHIDDIWEAKEIANLAISKVMLMSR